MTTNKNKKEYEQKKREYIKRKVAEEIRLEGETIQSISRKTWLALQAFIQKLAIRIGVLHSTIVQALKDLGAI